MHVSAKQTNVAYVSLSNVSSQHEKAFEDSVQNEQKVKNNNNKKENISMNSNSSCDTEDEVRTPLIKF